jgi:choline dehydrogenase-like flavoprotein
MFIDLNRVDRTHFRDRTFDVCVCGAGVAGITLARKLGAGLSVALLEGGGREYSYESQSLYRGRNIGLEYFDLAGTRLRYFGGTSNHWSGWMRPLDAHDFDARPDLDRPGWPIGQADLAPYLEEAKTTLGVSEARVVGSDATAAPLPGRVEGFHEVRFWINPIRFGERYAKDIESSTRIACYLHANVTDMRLDGNRVVHVAATNYAGKTFPVRARAFVLALGGIENPRILLNCNKQRPGGLGNQHGLVGRFFSEHPHLAAGAYLLEDGVPLSRTRIFSPARGAHAELRPALHAAGRPAGRRLQGQATTRDLPSRLAGGSRQQHAPDAGRVRRRAAQDRRGTDHQPRQPHHAE